MTFNKYKFIINLIIFFLISFGNVRGMSGDTTQEVINIKGQIEKLNKIRMGFCNDGFEKNKIREKLNLTTRPGKDQELCIFFLNMGEKNVIIEAGFSKGTINHEGKFVCDQDMGPQNDFSKKIYGNDIKKNKNIIIGLKPLESEIRKIKVSISRHASGEILGCISYKLKNDTSKQSDGIFNVIIRKSLPIKIIVTGRIYNYKRRDNIKENVSKRKDIAIKTLTWIIGIRLTTSIIQQIVKKKKTEL